MHQSERGYSAALPNLAARADDNSNIYAMYNAKGNGLLHVAALQIMEIGIFLKQSQDVA